MKILYDHQIFTSQVYGGISRYFCELMANYSILGEPDFDLALSLSNNSYLEKCSFTGVRQFFPGKKFRGKTTIITMLNDWKSRSLLKRKSFDIFHPTNYDSYFLEYIDDKPFVVTCYDMIHEIYPELFLSDIETRERKKLLVQKANRIIAISENTKRDLLRFYDVDERKISVIYLANSIVPVAVDQAKLTGLPKRYLFFVGERKNYKNFKFMLHSLAPLFEKEKDLCLVCAGGGAFSPEEFGWLKEVGVNTRAFQFSVNDTELAQLYQKALTFIFPSLYEGFGIPVLEAFACGCPAIISKSSSLPEVGGDAAVYFDPYDENSLQDVVTDIIQNPHIRKEAVNRGFLQLKRFSWAKTAQETRAVYESLL